MLKDGRLTRPEHVYLVQGRTPLRAFDGSLAAPRGSQLRQRNLMSPSLLRCLTILIQIEIQKY